MVQLVTSNQFQLVPELSKLGTGLQQGMNMRGQFDQRKRQQAQDTQEQSFMRADVADKILGELEGVSAEQRPALFQSMLPQIEAAGIDVNALGELDFSNEGIASGRAANRPLMGRSKSGLGLTTGERDFNSMVKGFTEEQVQIAREVQAGIRARASLSKDERVAVDEILRVKIAEQVRLEAENKAKGGVQGAAAGAAEVVDVVAETETTKDLAKDAAKHRAAAIDQLPTVKNSTRQLKGMINKLKNHNGLAGVVGMQNPSGFVGLAGTPEADFIVMLDQIKGGTFLKGFQSLKGGGTITEVEGSKAENALARLSVKQTEGQFKASLDDYLFELEELQKLVEMKAKDKSAPEAAQGGALKPVSQMTEAEMRQELNR